MKQFVMIAYTFCAVAVLVALTACNPYLHAESPAPPGRTARMDEVRGFWEQVKYYRIEVSTGVAIALTCDYGRPCEHVKITSDDPAIAEVRPASLSVFKPVAWGNAHEEQTASALVVVGKTPGTTSLHLRSDEGHRDVIVKVIAAPAPAAPQAVAN